MQDRVSKIKGWGCSSVVELLPRIHKNLSSRPFSHHGFMNAVDRHAVFVPCTDAVVTLTGAYFAEVCWKLWARILSVILATRAGDTGRIEV
jgi:hypothetical protein